MLEALEELTLLLDNGTRDIRVLNLSSYIKLILDDHNGAIFDLNKLINLTNDLTKEEKVKYKIENLDLFWNKIYFRRGLSKTYIGDKEAAIDDFKYSIKLYPNFGEAYLLLGF